MLIGSEIGVEREDHINIPNFDARAAVRPPLVSTVTYTDLARDNAELRQCSKRPRTMASRACLTSSA